jgi:hypothetical protein
VKAGTTATFDHSEKDASTFRQTNAEGDASSQSSSSVEHLYGHFTVTAEVGGTPTAMTITFNSDSSTIENGGAGVPASSAKSPLAGRTLHIAMDQEHHFIDDFRGDLDDDARDELRSYLVPDADLFPDHPVAIGDFWDASAKMAADEPLKKGDLLKQWCRLDSVTKVDGHSMAHLTSSYAMLSHDDPQSVRISKGSGTVTVDLDRGAVTDFTVNGTDTISEALADKTDKSATTQPAMAEISGSFDIHDHVAYSDPPTTSPAQ